jgi:hypothetical protein
VTIHHARALLWIPLIGLSISCAQRSGPETGPVEPTEASQETPPGVPAVVQPSETGEPSPPNQDVPPGVQPAGGKPSEAGQEERPQQPAAVVTEPPQQADAVAPPPETGSDESPEVRELMLLGPTYTPHDRAPTVVWDTDAQALLSRKLLPVLRSQALPARTRALFWLLLRPDGTIADVVPQTLTENNRFDAVAAEVVRQLSFTPAIRNDRAVAVWVIQEISLLMQ